MSTVAAIAAAVPVKSISGDYIAYGVWTLVLSFVGTVIVAWFRFKPAMEKASNEGSAALIGLLMDRVTKLEADQVTERAECAKKIEGLEDLVRGLQRQIIAHQVASGQPFPLHMPPETRKMVDRLLAAMDGEDELTPRRSMLGRRKRKAP